MSAESPLQAPLASVQGAGGGKGGDYTIKPPPTGPIVITPARDNTRPIVIRTNRGNIKISPQGEIEGLWGPKGIVRRELMSAAETRKLCGFRDRSHFAYHRHKDFPAPALRFPGKQPAEYWAKSDVRAWLAKRSGTADG